MSAKNIIDKLVDEQNKHYIDMDDTLPLVSLSIVEEYVEKIQEQYNCTTEQAKQIATGHVLKEKLRYAETMNDIKLVLGAVLDKLYQP